MEFWAEENVWTLSVLLSIIFYCRQIWSYACVHPNYTELQGNSIVELKLAGEDDGEFLVDAVLLTEEQPFKGGKCNNTKQDKKIK